MTTAVMGEVVGVAGTTTTVAMDAAGDVVAMTTTDRRQELPVAMLAGVLFCIVLIYLALQVRAGEDPAIGAEKPAASAQPVIVRRIVVRRIVEEPAGSATSSTGSAAASAPIAPAAPAPAPAPVVSGGS